MRLTQFSIFTFFLSLNACTAPVDLGTRDGGTEQGSVGGAGTTATTSATTGGQLPQSTGVGGQTTWTVRCGNAIIETGEQCDDANIVGGDGCSATCLLETGWVCPGPGEACNRPLCGDGEVQAGEACDLGQANGTLGSNCALNCQIKPASCGDAVVDTAHGELCDDGVNQGGHGGCAPDCTLAGFCGDGAVNGPEECDQGAANDNDSYGGCTTACKLGGYCGDGIVNGAEQCDLGVLNTGEYGGCTPGCKLGPYCGDGVIDESEECDNGALNGGGQSLCSLTCKELLPITD